MISGHKYVDTEEFQDNFIVGEDAEGIADGSLSFCVDYLNYMKDVTGALQEKTGDEEAWANGSILMPLDVECKSPILDELPSNLDEQKNFIIAESQDYVISTVDTDEALKSGGLKYQGIEAEEAASPELAAKNTEKAFSEELVSEEIDAQQENQVQEEAQPEKTGEEVTFGDIQMEEPIEGSYCQDVPLVVEIMPDGSLEVIVPAPNQIQTYENGTAQLPESAPQTEYVPQTSSDVQHEVKQESEQESAL